MQLHPEVNLQRFACVSAAAVIWERQLTKNKIRELCSAAENFSDSFYEFIKDVIKNVRETIFLPEFLSYKLLAAIKYMGLRITGWVNHLRTSFVFIPLTPRELLFENYITNIHWTHYGTIDEVKIYKSVWLNNPNVDICKMYNMACAYCLEEEVKYFWEKIQREKHLRERYQHDYKCKTNWNVFSVGQLNIIAYWNNIQNPSSISHFIFLASCSYRGRRVYDKRQPVDQNMLRLCAKFGYDIGFKYFWNRLDDEEKKRNAIICLKIILEQLSEVLYHNRYTLYLLGHEQDKYREICMILFQNLRKNNFNFKSPCISNLHLLIEMFTCSWPWSEFLFPFLVDLLLYLNDENLFSQFCNSLEKALEIEDSFSLPFENNELHKQLIHLWHIIPSKYKLRIAHTSIINFQWRWNFNLPTIKLILNDEHLTEYRQSLTAIMIPKFPAKILELIKMDFECKIVQLFCELLVPEKLNVNDQNTLKTIYKLLLQNGLSSADMLLNEYTSNDNKKKELKKQLAIQYLTYYFIEKDNFELADSFLLWVLETNEEVNDFKKNYQFASVNILNIWSVPMKEVESAVPKSDKFLNWLLNFSKEKINEFKIEKFKGIDHVDLAGILDGKLEKIGVIDRFLSWCLWTDKERKRFKIKVLSTFFVSERNS